MVIADLASASIRSMVASSALPEIAVSIVGPLQVDRIINLTNI